MSALGHKRTFCNATAMSALPPKADIAESCCHVRFVPKADILHCGRDCYSITSSARCWRLNGTDRPSALAVFRLMTVSYLFGACTGRSGCDAGLIARPLRVKSGHSGSFARCLLYPQKRTSILSLQMSALCQKRTLRSIRSPRR